MLVKEGKTNIKYLLIVAVLAAIVGGGILVYQYWWVPQEEAKAPEVKVPEEEPTIEEPVLNLTSTKLATIPEEYDWVNSHSITFSPDGRQIAYIAGKGEKEFMVINDKGGKPYDFVWFPVFSPDGKKIAYRAGEGNWEWEELTGTLKGFRFKEAKEFVVIDGKESEVYEISGSTPMFKEKKDMIEYDQPHQNPIIFSPDSKQAAYIVSKEGEDFVVINGRKEKIGSTKTPPESPIFSSDSKHIAYMDYDGKYHYIVIDGKRSKPYEWIDEDSLVFSPDSTKIAYIAGKIVIEKLEGREYPIFKYFVVINDEEGKAYNEEISPPIIFSPDGKKVAYIAGERVSEGGIRFTKEFLVINGEEGKRYHEIIPWTITFSRDSEQVGYIAVEKIFGSGGIIKEKKEFIVVNREEGKRYDEIRGFGFAPDGKIVYGITEGGKEYLIINDEKSNGYDWIEGWVTFSRDGKRVAFVVEEKEEKFAVIDGKEEKIYDEVGSPIFSPDSKHFVYSARSGEKEFIVINGTEGRFFDKVWFPAAMVFDVEMLAYNPYGIKAIGFDPDSKYIAYGAKIGQELWWIVDEVAKFGQ